VQPHSVVSQQDWIAARKALLIREKELTRARDELARLRRELPWVKVEKPYEFDTPHGRQSLAKLFGAKSQLVINHFMLAPGWKDGCVGCSFAADHVEGMLAHLAQRDVAYVAVSRAPLPEIEGYKTRMGWHFAWVSSFGSDFNFDYNVSFRPEELAPGRKVTYNYELTEAGIEELPGYSVFARDDSGAVYHTYSSFGRGAEALLGIYTLLDMLPKGREENGPYHSLMDWVKRHDEYDTAPAQNACCHGAAAS
jgi:predicted dithiol-disulfide oxidoreductase (DUF899 family)